MALVPQDNRPQFRKWRDRVKTLNPDIILLGYQVVIQETADAGPGNDELRKAQDAWCTYPNSQVPRIQDGTGSALPQGARIYDPRHRAWRTAFLNACRKTLASYPYEGLFLDMCTIVRLASPSASVRSEMQSALQDTLLELRKEFPTALLVGNSSQRYAGLNGAMNEHRPDDVPREFAPFSGYVPPRVELLQVLLEDPSDEKPIRAQMSLANQYGAFFGASVNYQHVLWFPAFDELLAAYDYRAFRGTISRPAESSRSGGG